MYFLLSTSGKLLIFLLIKLHSTPKANAQTHGESLWDECKNRTGHGLYLCGNVCLTRDYYCYCGDTILRYEYIPTRHCCSSDQCINKKDGSGWCPQGQVRDITIPCHDGKCYADYDDSYYYPKATGRKNFVTYNKSFFKCPLRDECLAAKTMCQGHSACGDHQSCNKTLLCDNRKGEGIQSLNQCKKTEIINEHFYCQYHRFDGNSVYDTINREDESITNTLIPKAIVNYSSNLTKCNADEGLGLNCIVDENKSRCYHPAAWCRSDKTFSCIIDGKKIASNDKTLCQDKLFWNNVTDCVTDRGRWVFVVGDVFVTDGTGIRCNGSLMHMIYPWYKYYNGLPEARLKQQCEDKSDQVFDLGTPCPDVNHYLKIHNQLWCNNARMMDEEICTNPQSWIESNSNKIKIDPHNCQSSCNEPGTNCIACRNENYFNCSMSGRCIHKDLVCDGHPQCPKGEDENYEMCKPEYLKKRVVEPFVTFKCKSKVYPNIYTIATACNNVPECLNDEDESLCDIDKYTTWVLVFLAVGILAMFISLKLPQILDFRKKRQNQGKSKIFKESHFHDILKKLKENPYDKGASKKINIYLLHILNTKKTTEIKKTFIEFYDNIAEVFQMEEAKIFCFLKANIHSLVTADVVEHKFRGLKTKIIEFIEDTVGKRIINDFRDKITETPSLRMSLSSLVAIYHLMSNFLDVAKDIALFFSLLFIMGGPEAIKEFPTNFSSDIVLCWLVTIILPVFASSLYLALYAPFLVFTTKKLKDMRGGKLMARL